MDSNKAHLIYWALTERRNWIFNFNQDDESYIQIKKARVNISKKYDELKNQGLLFDECEYLSSIEWLLNLER